MKKYIFPFLVALSALSLAGAAAFFSVTGLSKLFGGARTEVIIMASALEFAKIVTTSFLHRYWNFLQLKIKTPLIIGVAIVMIITSAGIYGFLSNAYSTTSGKLQNIEAQTKMVEQKKTIVLSEIKRLEETKDLKSQRVKSLTNLRTQQESRLDSLYNRRQIGVAKRVESQIDQANKEIASVNVEIDSLNARVQRKYAETTSMDMEVLELGNNDVAGDVGPLKYIAKLTGRDMDQVVNFFILLLIFVFDPLAVLLIIATNISFEKELGRRKGLDEEKNDGANDGANDGVIKDESINIEGTTEGTTDGAIEEIPQQETISEIVEKEPNEVQKDVINYIANQNGEFELVKQEEVDKAKQDILDSLKSQGVTLKDASYMSFLDVLFKNGFVSVGDVMPDYKTFIAAIHDSGLSATEKQVTDFLTICNLFKITDMTKLKTKKKAFILKDYEASKKIIAPLC